ncbi:hypothetical protein H1D32_15355 [Anaerobacillus sp. CMMVII]|uniref:hypothetical protein n=1 Tax=Anaerobacillus sp. CMMVII TaxID=2755588 RepID=UPI0021B795A2|nr:hypothetical protein [Anaerobacillus sp. CMMVII]MCT8138968.1 hypothetical protein [Anaerobacillus sp. CMMVII]
MKQWLILSSVVLLFLLVWGTIFYELIVSSNSKSYTRDEEIAAEILSVTSPENLVELVEEEIPEVLEESNVIEFTREQTELNKLMKPRLKEGIDYGEGISIDDLLQSFGVLANK